jgi:Damage-control phosphatase ARMT1-like domain
MTRRPPPLRTDGSNRFARYSMQTRVPKIARDLLEKNPTLPAGSRDAVEALARSIENDAPLPAPRSPAPDVEAWTAAHAEHATERWLSAEWFHAELAFYRELAHACRFWETDRDPFAPAKSEELAGERPWLHLDEALARTGPREERIGDLLATCLWGNRVDLSYTVGDGHGAPGGDDLLADDRAAAIPLLVRPGAEAHLVADNAGTELALDLGLVDALLEDPAARVTVHLKMQPVFVSDALPRDVWNTLDRMEARGAATGSVAARLRQAFAAGRLMLAPDPFWSGPRFLWEAPPHLVRTLARASLVVFKGDANYRRVVGDALWPADDPFAVAAAYAPSPLLCLRTMKSDSVVGLPHGLAERLDASDPGWRLDARRGVAQAFLG